MKLYFSRNLNPRLAVAAARFLNAPVEFEFASPFSPEQREKFLKLNPNQSVPILVEGDNDALGGGRDRMPAFAAGQVRLLADRRFLA